MEKIKVTENFGKSVPLLSVARITVSGMETLVVDPYDKTLIKQIESAIRQSDMDLYSSVDSL